MKKFLGFLVALLIFFSVFILQSCSEEQVTNPNTLADRNQRSDTISNTLNKEIDPLNK